MSPRTTTTTATLALALLGLPGLAPAFDSGSTGADGAFSPTVDTQLQLPPDGVFNYTSVNIPAGVVVTYLKNATNTPVTLLVSGDVTIAGTLDVSGAPATDSGAAGDGNLGDDGLAGEGGPGGFAGGIGGPPGFQAGGAGLGPGGGGRGTFTNNAACAGGGGGYSVVVGVASLFGSGPCRTQQAIGGPAYGTEALLPLVGGSGGGGGLGGENFAGASGGGGGGAILIAATGTVDVTGAIKAIGGLGGSDGGAGTGAAGGGGSGGAIRIVATTITGNGTITAAGGGRGNVIGILNKQGGGGAAGRIRLEAESLTRTAGTTPAFRFAAPGEVFVAGLPALRITSVAGQPAPAAPTGGVDIALPVDTPNPVTVTFEATGVPLGNTVTLTVTPNSGDLVRVTSPALAGTEALSTTSVSVDLPEGSSVLSAAVSFTVVADAGNALAPLAGGETVQRVIAAVEPSGLSRTTLVTVTGREVTLPSRVAAIAHTN